MLEVASSGAAPTPSMTVACRTFTLRFLLASVMTQPSSSMSQAIEQLLLMLEVAPGGTAPRSDEAQRILSFFLSSLKNPQLKRPPLVQCSFLHPF